MSLVSLAALVLLAAPALVQTQTQAQAPPPPYTQYGQHTERGGTRVAYWDNVKNVAAGQAAIDFGRPVWKAEYADKLDAMTSGKFWRMGENFWTSLDTNIPLTIGGVDVAAGYYYLVVARSEDGSRWSLALVEPSELRKLAADPFEVGVRPAEMPVRFEAPLRFEPTESVRERLVIELSENDLVIQWGSFELSAPVEIGPR